jgi:DNA-binding XRE family transcriptional regulator
MTAPKNPADPPAPFASPTASLASRAGRLLQAVLADAASLEAGLQALLQLLAPSLGSEEQARWEAHLHGLRGLLKELREHPLGALLVAGPAACAASVKREFAALVRLRREAAGLSRAKLARRTRVSEASLKLLESGRHCPSRFTLLRLLQARELGLRWEDIARIRPELRPPLAERPEPGDLPAGA